jgi:hypothetical protein
MKYPRTYHLPWSEGATSDDKMIETDAQFFGCDVVVTEKLDGENCTMTSDTIYARSMSSTGGILRERVKSVWASLKNEIPSGFRICGENVQWAHSIRYENLTSPFYVFSIWNNDTCLSWNDTLEYAHLFNLPTVPVLYTGRYDRCLIQNLNIDTTKTEGYVVRNASQFPYHSFSRNVAKYVRKNHVQTDQHWSTNLTENGFDNSKLLK